MSHTPARRKSSRARAAATANVATQQPPPHQVLLRVKRKRTTTAVESLVVTTEEAKVPWRKRRSTIDSIEDSLTQLGLNTSDDLSKQLRDPAPSKLLYKRVRTTEHDVSQKSKDPFASRRFLPSRAGTEEGIEEKSRNSDVKSTTAPACPTRNYLEVRRVKAKAIAADSNPTEGNNPRSTDGRPSEYHVIDLQPVKQVEDEIDIGLEDDHTGGNKANGKRNNGAPVLNPLERWMDETIFTAFQTGNLSSLRSAIASSPGLVNYQRRLGDMTTALMAVAFYGDLEAVRYLLSLGAKTSLLDSAGKSAALFAGMRGHHDVYAELQRLDDGERDRGIARKGTGHSDFVYDLYCFERGASSTHADRTGDHAGECSESQSDAKRTSGDKLSREAGAPVVHLSGIGPVDANAVSSVDVELELQFEHDSDWSELGEGDAGEDPDSNSEGYYGNDYPEEEGDEDGARGEPYMYDASSCASEAANSNGDIFSSDEDEYFQSSPNVRAFGRARMDAFGKPVQSSHAQEWPGPPTAIGSTSDSDDDEFFNIQRQGAEVFAWDPVRSTVPRNEVADEESLGSSSPE